MAVILLYHGVTDYGGQGIENYSGKHVDGDEFYRQMTILNRGYKVVSLNEWLETRQDDAVIITFDDSYEGVYVNALPVLKYYKFPATFYVSAGMVNTDLMYWTDKIECCLNYTPRQRVMGHYTRTEEERKQAAIVLKARGKDMSREAVRSFTDLIIEATDVNPGPMLCYHYRNISWAQLAEMSNNGFEIGGHGLYHDILGYMTAREQWAEITTTLNLLSLNLRKDIHHFSYPEGQEGHYTDDTVDLMRAAGVVARPTAIDGVNYGDTSPFHLRRVMVGFNGTPFPFRT